MEYGCIGVERILEESFLRIIYLTIPKRYKLLRKIKYGTRSQNQSCQPFNGHSKDH